MKKIFLIFFVLIIKSQILAQSEKIKAFSIVDAGIEFQLYPTGYVPGLKLETNLSKKDALNFRLAMNVFDHRDFPKKAGINEHLTEKGWGYGISFGYRHYFWENIKNLYVGFRSDLWYNKVNWSKDNPEQNPCNTSNPCLAYVPEPILYGKTNVLVVQPTINAGWLFELGNKNNFYINPDIAFGYEWNALMNNEQTGYGFIVLGGISAGYRFNKNK